MRLNEPLVATGPTRGARGRRRARPSWIRPALKTVATVAVLAAIGGAGAWTWQTGALQRTTITALDGFWKTTADAGLAVDDVLVVGRTETSGSDLLKAIGVRRGTPILGVDLGEVRDTVAALPWVKSVRVERRLPDILYVEITERTPMALWQRNGRLTLIDGDGVAITERGLGRFSSLPIVIGDGAPKRAREALDMLAGEPDLRARVRALTWVGDRRWTVRIDDGIDVQLPETGAAQAWKHLAALERDHGVLQRDVVTVDLRIPDQLIVRVGPDVPVRGRNGGKST